MARQKKDAGAGGASGNAGHNAALRAETIRDVYRQLQDLEAQRAEISSEISDLKNVRIKGDLGMKIADFNLGYRLYKLEGDDRKTAFDAIHEAFAALGIGEQLSMFSVAEKIDEKAGSDAGLVDDPDTAGYAAGKAGKKARVNPHPVGTEMHSAFKAGWLRGQAELAPKAPDTPAEPSATTH